MAKKHNQQHDGLHQQIAPYPFREIVQEHLFASAMVSPGLLFSRFFPCWQIFNNDDFQTDKPLQSVQKIFCSLYNKMGQSEQYVERLAEQHHRLDGLVRTRSGLSLQATATGPLAIGMGIDHPTENGFLFDFCTGAVFLPGSGIKGLCRAWTRVSGQEAACSRLFGYSDTTEGAAGTVIVLPAYPLKWPELDLDVICNHHQEYYQASPKKRRYRKGEYPLPLDVEDPNPVFHFSLRQGSEFVFRLIPRGTEPAAGNRDLEDMARLLTDALEWLGLGARTAVGYGTIGVREQDRPAAARTEEFVSMPGIIKTFVSYSHADEQQVLELVGKGSQMGIYPWLDNWELRPMGGVDLEKTLEQVIRDNQVRTVTLFLGRNSRDADWVAREMHWAREMNKHIIPILLDEEPETLKRLAELVQPDEPLFFKAWDEDCIVKWCSSILGQHQVEKSDSVVLYLSHRDGTPRPVHLPDEWLEKYPVIVLGNGKFWLDSGTIEPRTWIPKDHAQYTIIDQYIGKLLSSGSISGHIRIAGMAPLGVAGLIGKHWNRGRGGTLSTWNSFEKKEWSVDRDNPGMESPDVWQYLEEAEGIIETGEGKALMLGHFSREDQFQDCYRWVQNNGQELNIGKVVHLSFPMALESSTAPLLARECAQSFSWYRTACQADVIYWFCGLPLAMMPLITHLATSGGKIIFMDYDLSRQKYIQAFELV